MRKLNKIKYLGKDLFYETFLVDTVDEIDMPVTAFYLKNPFINIRKYIFSGPYINNEFVFEVDFNIDSPSYSKEVVKKSIEDKLEKAVILNAKLEKRRKEILQGVIV